LARVPGAHLIHSGDVKHPLTAVDQRDKAVIVEDVAGDGGCSERGDLGPGSCRAGKSLDFESGLYEMVGDRGADHT
jgi:hypothetical protein